MKIKLLNGEMYDQQLLLDNMYEDEFYYGELSKLALSSSALKLLLDSPKKYYYVTKYSNSVETQGLRDGKLMHTLILEPDKFEKLHFVDVQSKNTKKYKEAKQEYGVVYTKKEKEDAERLADAFMKNTYAVTFLKNTEFEVPEIGYIDGLPFRAKADILGSNKICDLKSTSDIKAFKYSSQRYGYDVQCYIYCQLFKIQYFDFKFLVIDKGTGEIGIYECSEQAIETGKKKVEVACDNYRKYFYEKTESVNEYVRKGYI